MLQCALTSLWQTVSHRLGPPRWAGTRTPGTTQVSWHENSQDHPGELAPELPGPPRWAGTRTLRTTQASWHQNSQDHPGDQTPRTTQAKPGKLPWAVFLYFLKSFHDSELTVSVLKVRFTVCDKSSHFWNYLRHRHRQWHRTGWCKKLRPLCPLFTSLNASTQFVWFL